MKLLYLLIPILLLSSCKTKTNVSPHRETKHNDTIIKNNHINNHTPEININEIKNLFNVKDFGAIGDFEHDDTQAIQACFEAIKNNGGGTAYFPSGTYKVSRTTLPGKSWCLLGVNNITLLGENKKNTFIKLASKQRGYTRLLILNDNRDIHINNITFDGNLIQQYNPDNPNEHLGGIFINQSINVHIKNSNFINTGGDGITIRGAQIPSKNINIESCFFNNNQRNGITLGSGFNDIIIRNCEFGPDIDNSPIDTEPHHGNCKNVLIESNLINTPSLFTLGGAKADNPGRNFIVKNNILNDCAIFMVRADSVQIINNKINIATVKKAAITCLGSNRAIYVDKNTITTENQPVFYLVKTRYSVLPPRDIHITNNNISVNGANKAFDIRGAQQVFIENNDITTNNCKIGIYCFSNYKMENINIINNRFSGFKTGVKILPLKTNHIKNISIRNNAFLKNVNTAIDVKHNGQKEMNLLENLKISNNNFSNSVQVQVKR